MCVCTYVCMYDTEQNLTFCNYDYNCNYSIILFTYMTHRYINTLHTCEYVCTCKYRLIQHIIFFHTVAPYNAAITTQLTGNNVIYTCTAEGGPSNTFEWTRSSDNSQVSNSSMLTLDHRNPTNNDTYTCTIENAADTISTMIILDGKKHNNLT